MTISIILITYNHEKYIEDALKGIALQQHKYEAEVVVADDCSADATKEIISNFSLTSPYQFRFLKREKNIGILLNYKDAFSNVKGDYIFILEGDDYWTDPLRVMKHVEFLEANPQCTMTMNRFTEFWQEENRNFLPGWNFKGDHEFISTARLANGNMLGNLSACCIRTSAWKSVEENLFTIPVADWMIGMVLAEKGPVALLKEPMSVYRKLSNGLWSGLSTEKETLFLIELIDTYNRYLQFRYNREFTMYRNRLTSQIQPVKKETSIFKKIISKLFHE